MSEWVHAVKMSEGAYLVSPEFAEEIKKHTIQAPEEINEIFGIKVMVSDTLPYLEEDKEQDEE